MLVRWPHSRDAMPHNEPSSNQLAGLDSDEDYHLQNSILKVKISQLQAELAVFENIIPPHRKRCRSP
jgi:hypothetical protein